MRNYSGYNHSKVTGRFWAWSALEVRFARPLYVVWWWSFYRPPLDICRSHTYTQPQSSPLTKMKTRLSEPTVDASYNSFVSIFVDCRTTDNEECVLPFTYKYVTYDTCTNKDHTRLWCATRIGTDGSVEKWENCAFCSKGWCELIFSFSRYYIFISHPARLESHVITFTNNF